MRFFFVLFRAVWGGPLRTLSRNQPGHEKIHFSDLRIVGLSNDLLLNLILNLCVSLRLLLAIFHLEPKFAEDLVHGFDNTV
jgi:hypothetical protein